MTFLAFLNLSPQPKVSVFPRTSPAWRVACWVIRRSFGSVKIARKRSRTRTSSFCAARCATSALNMAAASAAKPRFGSDAMPLRLLTIQLQIIAVNRSCEDLHKNSDMLGGRWKAAVSCLGDPMLFLVDLAKHVAKLCPCCSMRISCVPLPGSKGHARKLAGVAAGHALG